MPVIVNENKYLGLIVANGSEFVATGIVPDPNVQEHVVDEGLSIFSGPPALWHPLRGMTRIPHLPPNTIMRGTESIPLQKQKRETAWQLAFKGFKVLLDEAHRGATNLFVIGSIEKGNLANAVSWVGICAFHSPHFCKRIIGPDPTWRPPFLAEGPL
jgi:hypothetical protein